MAGYGIKALLIAQSLNQIEKAYGQNNSILDNCHVRVCFATNDERTAKRVSDALGTATEIRAQKNYAGHRLSPWLGHLMVSRQESARPLLTPGEIMQLPAADEIVMAAGTPPVRAKKARYYTDSRLQNRVLPPPPRDGAEAPSNPDDWTGLARPEQTPEEAPTAGEEGATGDPVGAGKKHSQEFDAAHTPQPQRTSPAEPDQQPSEADGRSAHVQREFADLQRIARLTGMDRDDDMGMDRR